ncbi:MAG: tetratricopeptide repeat protein, partial [Chloroflexi bacterium]|nr:tetratricopeptide repeat protein [Chloroflexota bacterium]
MLIKGKATNMEDHSYTRRQLEKESIRLAMESQWAEAVTVNKQILAGYPGDVEALNRLGRALMEMGEYQEAWDVYRKSLGIEADNTIARKNMDRLTQLIEAGKKKEEVVGHKVAPQLFIEETGKTGIIHLRKLAPR